MELLTGCEQMMNFLFTFCSHRHHPEAPDFRWSKRHSTNLELTLELDKALTEKHWTNFGQGIQIGIFEKIDLDQRSISHKGPP